MKSLFLALLGMVFLAAPAHAADKTPFKSDKEKVSYTIGYNFGDRMKRDGLEIDQEAFAKGIQDGLEGKKALMTPQERQEAIAKLRQQVMQKRAQQQKALAAKNQKAGAAFLAQYKKKPGVKSTKSGLYYRVLKAGKGRRPSLDDVVTVHYVGKNIDGSEFDSSYQRKKPATFPVKGVIKGWREALTKMRVGDKWELVVPPQLAYGSRGAPPRIGPDATLLFEVELLKVEKADKAKKPGPKPRKFHGKK